MPAGIRRRFAHRCAERIVALLERCAAPASTIRSAASRPLRPADIAVLVRTGREANEVRRELQRRRVASVYLSDQDSVFASTEARDLLHWLRAVAQPLDARLVRAALATRTIGLPLPSWRCSPATTRPSMRAASSWCACTRSGRRRAC